MRLKATDLGITLGVTAAPDMTAATPRLEVRFPVLSPARGPSIKKSDCDETWPKGCDSSFRAEREGSKDIEGHLHSDFTCACCAQKCHF